MTSRTLILLLFAVCLNPGANAGQKILYRDWEYLRQLKIYDVQTKASSKFYSATKECTIEHFSQSPDRSRVAVLESNPEHMRMGDIGYALKTLIVMDTSASVLAKVSGVLEYTWSPSGDSIAFTRGRDYGAMHLKFMGIGLVSLANPSSEVSVCTCAAFRINWPRHDGQIYFSSVDGISVIELPTKKIKGTNLKGMFFSSDGRYYVDPGYEGTGFQVYETETNREVTPVPCRNNDINFFLWVDGTRLIAGDITFDKFLIDISSGRVEQKFDGHVIGGIVDSSALYVWKSRKAFKYLNESTIERVSLKR